nr:TasA family protein [Fournierella massiliensis]
MKKKKLMMAVVSASLVGVVAIGGTLAYLSDKTDKVTNTFNVGSGYTTVDDHTGLWLDETKKTSDENPTVVSDKERTEVGVEYTDLMPADVIAKDPTFHLTEGSVESYVFAKVTGLDALALNKFIIKADNNFDDKVSELNKNWVKVDGSGSLDGLYRYNVTVGGTQPYAMDPMFQYIKFDADVDSNRFNEIKAAGLDDVTIYGVAVQAANMDPTTAQEEAVRVLQSTPEMLG